MTSTVMPGLASWCTYVGWHRASSTYRNDTWMVSVLGRTPTGTRITGSAHALSWQDALLSAWGESAERYCLQFPCTDRLFMGTAYSLPYAPLQISMFQPFDDSQWNHPEFMYERFDPLRVDEWTKAISLYDKHSVSVPASLVWLLAEPCVRLTAGVSTGTAAHRTSNEALRRGIYEVVERDAFTIVWESRSITPLVHPSDVSLAVTNLAALLSRSGRRLLLRDITTDIGIPVILAVIVDDKMRRPALALGAAARWTYREAAEAAAFEAYHTWVWMYEEHHNHPLSWQDAFEAAQRPHSMAAHPFLYGFPEAIPFAEHLWIEASFHTPSDFDQEFPLSVKTEVSRLVAHLTARGFEPFAVDITLSDVAQMGLTVWKVLIPGLVPLSIGIHCRPLGHPRLRTVPQRMSWPSNGVLPYGESPPHPFP